MPFSTDERLIKLTYEMSEVVEGSQAHFGFITASEQAQQDAHHWSSRDQWGTMWPGRS